MRKRLGIFVTIALSIIQGGLRADPLDKWFERTADRLVGSLNAVAFGNGSFVTVGDGILTSPDGNNWISQSAAFGSLTGVTCGNGRYVAVGLGKTILTSPDGTNWTKQYSGDPDWVALDFLGVGYGNGMFVAVGSTPSGRLTTAPVLRTSSGGENWVNHPSTGAGNFDFRLDSVAYGNGIFIATGNTGTTSSNGVDWVWPQNPALPPPPVPEEHIAFGDGRFIFVSSLGDIYFDGSWIQQGWEANKQTKDRFYGVTYGAGYYVAVGETYDDSVPNSPPIIAPLIKTSTDGTNWTSRSVNGVNPLYAVAFGQNTFVAVGGGIILQSDYLMAMPTILTRETQRLPDGSITVAVQSSVGDKIAVESSEDLTHWSLVTTVTNSAGVATVTDWAVQNQPQRFYRAEVVSP
jgi:hypothetical protein